MFVVAVILVAAAGEGGEARPAVARQFIERGLAKTISQGRYVTVGRDTSHVVEVTDLVEWRGHPRREQATGHERDKQHCSEMSTMALNKTPQPRATRIRLVDSRQVVPHADDIRTQIARMTRGCSLPVMEGPQGAVR
mgnify:CR=1 FL=1